MTSGSNPLEQVNTSLVWQLVEKLDEQRRHPRIPLAVKAALRTNRGDKLSALVLNMSPDGMQLRCDVESARLLHPGGGRIEPGNAPWVNAAVVLPIGSGSRTLAARCQLMYLTTVDSEPRCVFGLRFGTLDRQSEGIINRFFADQLALDTADAASA